jgi:FkbM family methyltransferase
MFYQLKQWLEQRTWYLRFRYHPNIISFWLKFRKSVVKDLNAQMLLYQSALKDVDPKLIFDVGANEGFITSIFNELRCHVIAIEPSPRNFSILKARFSDNKAISLIHAALSGDNEPQVFFENRKNYATGTSSEKWKQIGEVQFNATTFYSADPIKIPAFTLDDIVNKFGMPGFVKIDVEGSEQTVLTGLTQPVPFLSFEAILPFFMNETLWCIEHLHSLSSNYRFNYVRRNRFVHDGFLPKEKIIESIKSLSSETIEVFCKNSPEPIF